MRLKLADCGLWLQGIKRVSAEKPDEFKGKDRYRTCLEISNITESKSEPVNVLQS